jgi:uncharacterized protein (TIGR03067 family)
MNANATSSHRRRSRIQAVIIFFLACVGVGQAGVAARQNELQGTWIGQRSQVGDSIREFKPGEVKMVFTAAKLLATGIVTPSEATLEYSVDATKSPKHLDYVDPTGKKVSCIYAVSGDTLTLAVPRRSAERPTSLEADSKRDAVIMTLKRQR